MSFRARRFQGTIVRNSDSIDPASRTLNVEVDVDNAQGRIKTGAYVFVHLKLPPTTHTSAQSPSLTIPANTLLFRSEGLRVGVVRNGHAELVPITIGRDFGATVEVVAGLQPTDQVIVNPSDSLTSGTPVRGGCRSDGGLQMKRHFVLTIACAVSLLAGRMYGWSEVREAHGSHGSGLQRAAAGFFQEELMAGNQLSRAIRRFAASGGRSSVIHNSMRWKKRLTVSNQDLKVAEARFRQARADDSFQSRCRVSDHLHLAQHRQ